MQKDSLKTEKKVKIAEESAKKDVEKTSKKAKILLDTNFLIIPRSIGVDILSEFDRLFGINCYDLYVFDKSENELKKLLETYRGKERQHVMFSLTFLAFLKKAKGLKILSSQSSKGTGYLDDIIVDFINKSRPDEYFVATVDRELTKRLQEAGNKVVAARKMKFLFIK